MRLKSKLTLNNKMLVKHIAIDSVLIHGSYIHGEYNKHSDIDFIVVIDSKYYKSRRYIQELCAKHYKKPKHWFKIYTKGELYRKALRGDYFLWSVKLHHKVIFSRSSFLRNIFRNIKVYKCVRRTLYYDKLMLNKFINKYRKGKVSKRILGYKIGQSFRDVCINILYLNGIIEFGKYKCVRICRKRRLTYMPFSDSQYRSLYTNYYRLNNKNIILWKRRFNILYVEALKLEKRVIKNNFRSPLIKKSLHTES